MTLTTHALMGAAAASFFPGHHYLAFMAGFTSHFVIDAIPHWDYANFLHSVHSDKVNPLNSYVDSGKTFLRDTAIVVGDAFFGVALTFVIFVWFLHVPFTLAFIGAGAGIYPDLLSMFYLKTKLSFFEPLQRFHSWCQWWEFNDAPPFLGAGLQVVMVILVVFVLKYFYI